MADAKNNNATPIPPERCTPGGLSSVDAMDWMLRTGMALLAISAIWFVIVALRPLPGGVAPQPPAIPGILAIDTATATIEQRQDRLAALNRGGNIFAPDRRNWPVQAPVASAATAAADQTPGRTVALAPTTTPASAHDIDSIELATDAPSAVKKRLEQLKLRGVYVANGDRVAMIGQKTNPSSESYRVGDTFADGEWRLVAIDDVRDRVILNRSGLNFELALYDTGTGARANTAPRASISATNAPGEVEVGFTSLDRVATELRDAGLPRDQINELITLVQQTDIDDGTDTDTDADTNADAEDNAKPIAIPPAMPPGMIQLFKAMAEGSRDVAAPAPVKESESAKKTDADKSDKSDSSERKDK